VLFRSMAQVTRGTSQVLHGWESVEGKAYGPGRTELGSTDRFRSLLLQIYLDERQSIAAGSREASALYAWTGMGPKQVVCLVVDRSLPLRFSVPIGDLERTELCEKA
jgi:hypothetical protein